MVRPDGKISLGFYGEVQVRGMTVEQVKVAIIKHLRKTLTDECLGLEVLDYSAGTVHRPRKTRRRPNPRKNGIPFRLTINRKTN